MKRSLSILFAAALPAALFTMLFAACGPKGPKPEATITGTVTGIADGTKVWLDSEQARLDSTVVEGGKFRFEIAKAYPDMNAVEFDGGNMRFPFIVEAGTIVADIDATDPAAPVSKFSGTPSNDGMNTIEEGTAAFAEKMNVVETQLAGLQRGTPSFDSLLEIYYGINDEVEAYRLKSALETQGSVLAPYFIWGGAHALTTPADMDSVLTIVEGLPANAFTDKLRERREILAKTAVGVAAPDFTQAQPDGTPLSLSSLRGKLVLIDFWASWCGPCRAENPNVVKLYNRFKDKGFEILGVSLDDSRENWLKAIEDDGLTWRHVSDVKGWQNAVAKEWAVRSIPHTVLVGPDGVIIAKNLRGADLEAKVAEMLGE